MLTNEYITSWRKRDTDYKRYIPIAPVPLHPLTFYSYHRYLRKASYRWELSRAYWWWILFFSVTGDITQKGYEKKRGRLLAPFIPKETPGKLEFFPLIFRIGTHVDCWKRVRERCTTIKSEIFSIYCTIMRKRRRNADYLYVEKSECV